MIKLKKSIRHIRWNWENSPDSEDMVRYHFVIVDDKFREGTMENILMQIQNFGSLEIVRSEEGKVEGTKFRYLFHSYDSNVAPRILDWSKVKNCFVKRDSQLRERRRGFIEDYVFGLYS